MAKQKTAEEVRKELLVKTAFEAGLGDEEFLSGLDIKNLETMVTTLNAKDTELEAVRVKLANAPKKSNGDDYSKSTTVDDLVKNKRLKVAEAEQEKK